VDEKKEYVLSKQLLRCGTSVGANIEEAIGGQSDFFLLNLQLHTKKQEKLITGFVY
jgi:four helix bundle protein